MFFLSGILYGSNGAQATSTLVSIRKQIQIFRRESLAFPYGNPLPRVSKSLTVSDHEGRSERVMEWDHPIITTWKIINIFQVKNEENNKNLEWSLLLQSYTWRRQCFSPGTPVSKPSRSWEIRESRFRFSYVHGDFFFKMRLSVPCQLQT